MGDYVGTGHNVIESDCNFVRHCIFVDKYEMFMMFAFVNLSVIYLRKVEAETMI